MRSPFLRSDDPVSVRSTIASTMSGTLASVAPYDGTTIALTPCSARNRSVSDGNSVEILIPSGRSATDCHGALVRHREHHPDRVGRRLGVLQLAERDHVRLRSR